ncbi:Mam3p LALA0_S12e00870g [Lachancea lanzarotensis]|uniref:LALA0S12e00870g1_1 n=1 Tax=Lachancea lanzarotensis TaxID=1245769 RepID=A0A0C7NDY7_9SACH|nr:uncharacterized protein LALA0_S12e00870g [Lachancea lanzarotensis]CEP64526.1 LALA0S12e00870g1_1 [Lachancea lanzarotensis]
MSSSSALFSVRRAAWLFSLIRAIHGSPLTYMVSQETKREEADTVTFLCISVLLVLLGGVFAGLTLGLMGQDEVYLKVISSSGSPGEQKSALRVLKLISKGKHWVLVTLLLSNVITNETLPIVLDRCLGGGWQAVVSSTVLIVVFGEIIPQSVCVRYGLEIGAFFCPFVELLMYLMYPIAYPIALLLDWILGEDHGTMYKKSGLKTLVTLHRTMGVERLTKDEVIIISAVLDLKEKKVREIMTPLVNVFTMSADAILDEKTVGEIFNSGFSRIPIHLPGEKNNFIGMLLVRVLISYDPDDCLPVSHFPLATLPETSPNTSCLNILNYFQEGKSHMCIVSKEPGSSSGALGVLTLEDVIEELIGEEIVDESDVFVDIHQRIMRDQPGPLAKRHVTSYLHSLYKTSQKNPADHSSEDRPLLEGPRDTTQTPCQHTTVLPFNLASNPIETHNPHVKVKKLPENVEPLAEHRSYGGTGTSPRDQTVSDQQILQNDSVGKENALVQDHLDASKKAIQYTLNTGENSQVTTSRQLSPEAGSDNMTQLIDAVDGSHSGSDLDQKEHTDTQMISSSYRPSINGIVESVVTVKGVPKTIIAPARGWDECEGVVIDETGNVHENGDGESNRTNDLEALEHPSPSRPQKSRRGSLFSLFRASSVGGSGSSIRGRSTHTSGSSEKIGQMIAEDNNSCSPRNTN